MLFFFPAVMSCWPERFPQPGPEGSGRGMVLAAGAACRLPVRRVRGCHQPAQLRFHSLTHLVLDLVCQVLLVVLLD